MDKTAWCRACRDLAERQSGIGSSSVGALRDALAALDGLMLSAPWAVRNQYTELDEGELAAAASTHAARIEDARLGWAKKAVGAGPALWALAVQIRAVDALLAMGDSRRSRPPARSMREWQTSDGSAFVIPTRRPRDLGGAAGDNIGYSRRGIPNHRIVPKRVGGMPVQVVPIGTLVPGAGAMPLLLGAALFPEYSLDPKRTRRGFFRAKATPRPDLSKDIEAQLDALTGSGVLVWPELTVDDDALRLIQEALASRAFAAETPLNIAIPGTWHRKMADGRFGNVAPILDGCGSRKGEYAKVAKFRHEQHGWEDVAQGDRLVVLVCDRFMASVAICKDFCDLNDDPPWKDLDVDLILVPSMGRANTMAGHLHHANANRIHRDQRVLVVQHGLREREGDPGGFVLLGARNPPTDPMSTATRGSWATGAL